MANPAQGCRYISAKSPKEPAVGCAADISARAHIIGRAINAAATKLRITAGPASLTEMALPRNKPVPMVLPKPSMASCAGDRLRCKPDSRATMVVERLSSIDAGGAKGGSFMARHRNRNADYVLLSSSTLDLTVGTVNDEGTDCPSNRSRGIGGIPRIKVVARDRKRRHGGGHEGPGCIDRDLHRHVFPRDSRVAAKFRASIAARFTEQRVRASELEHRPRQGSGHPLVDGTGRRARHGAGRRGQCDSTIAREAAG